MTDHQRCKTCGEYAWFPGHKCNPQWEVWDTENGEDRDDGRTVRAVDYEDAAEKYAEEDDQYGDYAIIGGSPVTVHVAPIDSDDVRRVSVEGEAVPRYRARELNDGENA